MHLICQKQISAGICRETTLHKTGCFLWGEIISEKYVVQQPYRRDPVHSVRQLNTQNKALDLAKNRKDYWGDKIAHRASLNSYGRRFSGSRSAL